LPFLTGRALAVKTERFPAYGLPPITDFDGSLGPALSTSGIEMLSRRQSRKDEDMIERKSNRPTHRVYAVRRISEDRSRWAEIGAAWAHKDGQGFSLKLNLPHLGKPTSSSAKSRKRKGGAQ
jgi:hypothetical protein